MECIIFNTHTHTHTQRDQAVYVYGGFDGMQYLNDLYALGKRARAHTHTHTHTHTHIRTRTPYLSLGGVTN